MMKHLRGQNCLPLRHISALPAVVMVTTLMLSGCDSNGNGNDENGSNELDSSQTLESEEAQIEASVQMMAEDIDATDFNLLDGSDTGTLSKESSAVTTLQQWEDCPDEGRFLEDEEVSYSLDDLNFPEPPFDTSGPAPNPDFGARYAFDGCVSDEEHLQGEIDGQMNVAEFGNGGDVFAAYFGGINDDGVADTTSFLTMEVEDEGSIEMLASLHACAGCINGELDNLTGDNDRNLTMTQSAWIEGRDLESGGDIPDMPDFRMISGEDPRNQGEPIIVQAKPSDQGEGVQFSIDGREAYTELNNENCGYDLTFETVDPLHSEADNVDDIFTADISGEIEVTANRTGNTHTVEFDDGDIFVNGEEVTEEHRSEIQENCDLLNQP
ncbi:hypothetical protein [Halorhodospira halochloris]|uniref:hypothetical protein n=1 Tax=Halorhodospira halochloris TaxID=1052 RepID=UPI001EE80436|nr:hypothetical protein [Halorhodospira halochloris]MCG5549285.1 hypothetical protein [Halorhodospira halochloris]